MSDKNISCGPFWLLEQICKLAASRTDNQFKRIIATSGWYLGVFYQPTLQEALRILNDIASHDGCSQVNGLKVKLKFFTFPIVEDQPHEEWWVKEVLRQYMSTLDIPLYGDYQTPRDRPSQFHWNETNYYLPLKQAIRVLTGLNQFDFAGHGEDVQMNLQVEIAPWRNTRPKRDSVAPILYVTRCCFCGTILDLLGRREVWACIADGSLPRYCKKAGILYHHRLVLP